MCTNDDTIGLAHVNIHIAYFMSGLGTEKRRRKKFKHAIHASSLRKGFYLNINGTCQHLQSLMIHPYTYLVIFSRIVDNFAFMKSEKLFRLDPFPRWSQIALQFPFTQGTNIARYLYVQEFLRTMHIRTNGFSTATKIVPTSFAKCFLII